MLDYLVVKWSWRFKNYQNLTFKVNFAYILWNIFFSPKGQLIWKENFGVFNSSKNQLENLDFSLAYWGKKFSFAFGRIENTKISFKIIWPLITQSYYYLSELKRKKKQSVTAHWSEVSVCRLITEMMWALSTHPRHNQILWDFRTLTKMWTQLSSKNILKHQLTCAR